MRFMFPGRLASALVSGVCCLVLASACSAPANSVYPASQAAADAVVPVDTPQFAFNAPQHWVRTVQRPGTNEQFTMSSARYSRFKFTLLKVRYEADGVEPTLAELCSLQDQIRSEGIPTGAYERKDYRIDGRLCCYGIYKEKGEEAHVLSTVVGQDMYIFLYAFGATALLDDTQKAVTADMERVFQSWHWKPVPSPTPRPSPSPSAGLISETPDYFPVAQGWRWTYRVLLDNETVGTLVTTAKEVDESGDSVTMAKHWEVSKPIPSHKTDETEVFEKFLGTLRLETGTLNLPVLRAFMKVNVPWEEDGHQFVIETFDETVPTRYGPVVGALKVVQTAPDGTKVSRWYTEDLGLVQEITETKGSKLSLILEDFQEAP